MPPAAIADRLVSAEELLDHPEWGHCELIDGKVVPVSPPNMLHGNIAYKIAMALGAYVEPKKCGVICVETGFIISRGPDTVRAPDVLYIAKERLPAGGIISEYLPVPPDLAVEVISPSDRYTDVTRKVDRFIEVGVRVVWVVDPQIRGAQIHRKVQPVQKLGESDALSAEEILPGFSLPLTNLFV
jgi:Uma2 family endonuclease